MASDVKSPTGPRSRADALDEPTCTAADAVLSTLATQASRLRTRRGQNIALTLEGGEAVFIVRSGAFMLHVTMPDTPRQVVAFFFRGDVLRSSFAPPHANATLTSASAAEVWRLRWTVLEGLAAADPALACFLQDAMATQMARHAVHVAAIGQFSGEQRVATVLTELAMRTGMPTPAGGLMLDMPFSRKDIADYLGLNSDTLSRIMSRLRSTGVLGHSERSRALVRDFQALARLSPAARSLAEIHRGRRGGPCQSKLD